MKRSYYLPACTALLLLVDSVSASGYLRRIWSHNVSDYFEFEHPNLNVRASFAASNLEVFRVYASGTGPFAITDVFGEVGRKMEVYSNSGTFFNVTTTDGFGNTVHYDTAPDPALFNSNPALAYDTFASIGLTQAPSGTDQTMFTPGFIESANHFQTDWASFDAPGHAGGWSVSGFPAQIQAVEGPVPDLPFSAPGYYYMSLMQFTVSQDEYAEGRFAVVRTDKPNRPVFYGARSTWATIVPAPSAWGLCVAALLGVRRRRSR